MMPMKLSTTDPTTPKKSPRTLSIADLASPLALTSPAASVRSYFFTSPSVTAAQQQQQQAELEEQEKNSKLLVGIQNSCYNYFYYNQAELKQSIGSGGSGSGSNIALSSHNNSSHYHHNNNTINLHSIGSATSIDDKQILEKYGERIQKTKRLALQELHVVLNDAQQFQKLQQRLRDASCQTNGALKQCWAELICERGDDYKAQVAIQEAQQRASAEALASRLDQVNLENEKTAIIASSRSSSITGTGTGAGAGGGTPSPKSIMDLPFSSPSPAGVHAGNKVSAKSAAGAAMVDAVMDLPFSSSCSSSTPEEEEDELMEVVEEEDEEEADQVQTRSAVSLDDE
jgi:hypothetical protein